MIVSFNWLKKFTDIDISVDKLATLIGERLVEIEGIKDLGEKYKDVLVVKVIDCVDVEGSDHLHLTKIDDGGALSHIQRDASGYVQVVCGASNVRTGMLAAWLPPETIVPETFGTKEPFVLGSKELKGYKSHGMLASAKELDLFDDHSGIVEIDQPAKPGTKFAELYELNDYLLDIENKSLTHRPDAFGLVGFAREVAGIQGKQFKTPPWLSDLEPKIHHDSSVAAPKVTIQDPELSDRFEAIVLTGADEKAQSPLSMQTYLARSGIRPVNAIVDVTNYLMLVTGQPLHAYDYDKVLKVSGGKADISVRAAKKQEKLKLLDGKVLTLDTEDIVIAAGETAIGLAGAMGGADTEIDSSTKRILLECATFNLYKLRNMQMRHGIFTEAITRLTKGIPAPLGAPVLAEAVKLLGEYAGAKAASPVGQAYPGKTKPATIKISIETIDKTLGTQFAAEDVQALLENVEFGVTIDNLVATVTIPYWRNDIHIPEDIIEEVGRLYGFDSINLTLPQRDFTAIRPEVFDVLRNTLRSVLVRSGANEVLTYSFIHGDIMQKAGQNPTQAYRLTNSLSPDLQYYRQSVLPSLLAQVHPNIKAGYDHFALFEMNKFHTKLHEVTEEKVPKEIDSLAFVIARNHVSRNAAYYEAKRYLDYIADTLGLTFIYEPLEEKSDYPVTQPFEPKRSARVWEANTRERVGVIGEFKYSVRKGFKLPQSAAGFEISPRALLKLTTGLEHSYRPLSKYPGTERDICFQVATNVTYQQIVDSVQKSLADSELINSISPVDMYQPKSGDTKNITIRIALGSYDKTLTGEEVAGIIEGLTKRVVKTLKATVI